MSKKRQEKSPAPKSAHAVWAEQRQQQTLQLTWENGSPTAWLTWCLFKSGAVSLRCVSISEIHAGYALTMVQEEMKTQPPRPDMPGIEIVRVWQEKVMCEHCFGHDMLRDPLALQSLVKPRW